MVGQINPIHALYYSLVHKTVFIYLPSVCATKHSNFFPLHFTNQYISVSSTNHEATRYVIFPRLLLPPLPCV